MQKMAVQISAEEKLAADEAAAALQGEMTAVQEELTDARDQVGVVDPSPPAPDIAAPLLRARSTSSCERGNRGFTTLV